MKILFFGDVFGRPGRDALLKIIPEWREKFNPDAVIANVENIAHGTGVNRLTLEGLKNTGFFSAFTSGDHIWDDGEARQMLEEDEWMLVRPENFPSGVPGQGHRVVQVGTKRLLVINVLGRSFIKFEVDSPFRAVDSVLEQYTLRVNEEDDKEHVDAIFVDFHAETTSEKRAMAFHTDGRISGLVGTHTHVPTADAQIMPKGTGYLTDSGMVGPYPSVIGMEPSVSLERFLRQMPVRKEIADTGKAEIGAALIETGKDGLCIDIRQVREIVDLP